MALTGPLAPRVARLEDAAEALEARTDELRAARERMEECAEKVQAALGDTKAEEIKAALSRTAGACADLERRIAALEALAQKVIQKGEELKGKPLARFLLS